MGKRIFKTKEQVGVLKANFSVSEGNFTRSLKELEVLTGLTSRIISKWKWEELRKLRLDPEMKELLPEVDEFGGYAKARKTTDRSELTSVSQEEEEEEEQES